MPKFAQFDGYRVDVRSRDHNPPHFHVIGPEFHALIRIADQVLVRGTLPVKIAGEVTRWAALNLDELMAEWVRLNERDE